VVRERWLVEHSDYVAGRRFRDTQLAGPFAGGRTCTRWTRPARAASQLTDDVDFALPLGALGTLAGGRFAAGELARLFATATP
jgi:ligand-binding SRPBCC domain-containing protein